MAAKKFVATAEESPNGERVRQHHEELSAVPSILPALALLIPFAGALWARIKIGRKKAADQS